MERFGNARAVGAIAKDHPDLVLVELENIAKWEHTKKSSGFLGFIKVLFFKLFKMSDSDLRQTSFTHNK